MGILQEFNINELAGATGLILGAVSGILVVIFKSRCYCKFRLGCSDNFNLCMCERKPPPDPPVGEDTDEEQPEKPEPLVPTKSKPEGQDSPPEPQSNSPEREVLPAP